MPSSNNYSAISRLGRIERISAIEPIQPRGRSDEARPLGFVPEPYKNGKTFFQILVEAMKHNQNGSDENG